MNKDIKKMFRFLRPYILLLLVSLIFSAVSVVFTLLIPVWVGDAVDMMPGIGSCNIKGTVYLCILIAAAAVLSALFRWLSETLSCRASSRAGRDLRSAINEKLDRLPVSRLDQTPRGDFVNTVTTDVNNVTDGMLSGMIQLFSGAATIIGTLVFMLRANAVITLAVVILTPVSLAAAAWIAKSNYKYFKEQALIQGKLSGEAEEMFGSSMLLNSCSSNEIMRERLGKLNATLQKTGFKAQFASALTNPVTRFVNGLVYAAVGIIGALYGIQGLVTVGQISMFLTYANQYAKPFNEISGIISGLQSAASSFNRIQKLLDAEEETAQTGIAPDEGGISFDNIDFSYVPGKKVIKGVSLKAERGAHIAVVGPTGCGKTTLINLLMRFYDPDSGVISYGNKDITGINRASLRSKFGMVLQDTWLFNGTVRENIAFGREGVTDADIENAAKRARAHQFIKRLPQGYDTVISSTGSGLSQGEMQLLCIARAMTGEYDVLILDEATSSIDTLTEVLVRKAFTEICAGRTSIMIAHRLSTIRNADLIAVMKDGALVQAGKHEKLIKEDGFYRELYESMTEQ